MDVFFGGSQPIDGGAGIRESSSTIHDFEKRHHVVLPESYKAYLLKHPCTEEGINSLEEWCQPGDENKRPAGYLAKPFPHSSTWNDHSLYDHKLGYNSEYYNISFSCGSMRVCNLGCERYMLLIVSGGEAGTVWIDDRACDGKGIYPIKNLQGKHLSFSDLIRVPGWSHKLYWRWSKGTVIDTTVSVFVSTSAGHRLCEIPIAPSLVYNRIWLPLAEKLNLPLVHSAHLGNMHFTSDTIREFLDELKIIQKCNEANEIADGLADIISRLQSFTSKSMLDFYIG